MEKLTREAETHTEIKPWNTNDWNKAEKIEVSFIITTATEKKVFKGLIDLSGIIKL